MTRVDILGIPRHALGDYLQALEIGKVHTNDVFAALHTPGTRRHLLKRLGPQKLARLQQAAEMQPVTLVNAQTTSNVDASSNDAEKLLFRLHDGKMVEGVLLPQASGRVSFCVSSQAGCGMGCTFCATARLGFERNLTTGEIVGQVILAAERCHRRNQRLSSVVFMGMGEPLHNYRALNPALHILQDHHGLMLPARGLTVSTVGLVKEINRLAEDFAGSVSLALSLVAGTQATREEIVPAAKRYSLEDLKSACARYPLPGARRYLLIEYALLPGVNDTDEELEGVANFTQGLQAVVNLIPWNPFPGAPFSSPSEADIDRAWKRLNALGVKVTVRRPRGRRVYAACGQLARQTAGAV